MSHEKEPSAICILQWQPVHLFKPTALRTAKTPASFGRSECKKVKQPVLILPLVLLSINGKTED